MDTKNWTRLGSTRLGSVWSCIPLTPDVGTIIAVIGLVGFLIGVFETPDKLVLWFKNHIGTHNTVPMFILERTRFEVEDYIQAV